MKSGLSVVAMAQELERRENAKKDYIADTTKLEVVVPEVVNDKASPPRIAMDISGTVVPFEPGVTFRRQVAAHYKVPQDYSERILTAHPALYANTYNTFFQKEPARRMIRTLDGTSRAFLSDRFRRLDNYDLIQAVLPTIMEHLDIRIESTEFTDSRFYLKAVFPRIQAEVKKGDVVQIGLVISNSEVGAGALSVLPMVYRLICLNGMISPDYGQRKYHVGKQAEGVFDAAFELYSDETKRLDDVTFFSKVKDTVKGVLTHDVLDKLTNKLRDATEQRIEGTNIQGVVEVVAKKFAYGESTKGGILRHLIEGGDLSKYGLLNAVTRQSQDEDDYDLATRMEADGARILELPKDDWKQIGQVALAKAA